MLIAVTPSSFAAVDSTALDLLNRSGHEIRPNPFGRRLTEAEAIENLQGVHGVIAGLEPLNRKVLESAKDLKAIARVGIGIANVDLDAAKELGIAVSNTPNGPTEAVAEMTLAAALTLSRNLISLNQSTHAGKWDKSVAPGLRSAIVLFVGFGRIGQRTAQHFRAFGAQILAFDPYLPADAIPADTELVSLTEGLARADVISIHASGEYPILTSKEFAKIKKGAILLNSARGELVDEAALIDALRSGQLSGAWFDAFWKEPYTGTLSEFENVLMTPHVSTYTAPCRREMELEATKNLLRDLPS